jgi:integrase/recombinase XerD
MDETVPPADRITPARVNAYVSVLEQYNATQTVMNRLQELHAVAVVMGPDRGWTWIFRIYSRIRTRHRPARPKHARWVPARKLFEFGICLMAEAEQQTTPLKRAMQFRDGLIISFLVARPIRLRNLTGLDLDRTLLCHDGQWWIEVPASETKTKHPIDLPWPETLLAPLEIYLARHREVLVQMRRHSADPAGSALWVSEHGSPMHRGTIYAQIRHRTREGLGQAINPHLFRDCATTSIAIEDPGHIGIASPLLGHLTSTTTERNYNQARSIEATRRLQQTVLSLRSKSVGRAESDYNDD